MKTVFKLIFVLLLLFKGTTNAQCRLGYSVYEVKEELIENNCTNFKDGYTEDGQYFFHAIISGGQNLVYYGFSKETHKCIITIIYPLSNEMLNALVEKYNREFVIINNYTWKWYTPTGNVVKVEMKNYVDKIAFSFTDL